jgi:hypothetical protein
MNPRTNDVSPSQLACGGNYGRFMAVDNKNRSVSFRSSAMNRQTGIAFCLAVILAALTLLTAYARTTAFSKAQVADRIRKVEDGVDQFRNYLEDCRQDVRTSGLQGGGDGT